METRAGRGRAADRSVGGGLQPGSGRGTGSGLGALLGHLPHPSAGHVHQHHDRGESAVTTPITNVAPVAIEKATWMASTMAGMNGSTWAWNCGRDLGQDGGPQVADPGDVVQQLAPAAGERVRELRRQTGFLELLRDLLQQDRCRTGCR